MGDGTPTVTLSNIPGVMTKHNDETVEVHFLNSLTYDEWHEVEVYINNMLQSGSMHYIFDFQQLANFTSYDIGMWVTLNTNITSASATLEFVLGRNSNALKYMKLAKLDQIFSVSAQDPDQDAEY